MELCLCHESKTQGMCCLAMLGRRHLLASAFRVSMFLFTPKAHGFLDSAHHVCDSSCFRVQKMEDPAKKPTAVKEKAPKQQPVQPQPVCPSAPLYWDLLA